MIEVVKDTVDGEPKKVVEWKPPKGQINSVPADRQVTVGGGELSH